MPAKTSILRKILMLISFTQISPILGAKLLRIIMKTEKSMAAVGTFLLMISVVLGAFGAHMLEDRLDLHQLEIYQKAANYLTVHALALVIATLLPIEAKSKYVVGILFLSGIALFSGSLFMYSLSFLFTEDGV
jgi:uncharacterized membrane protein YgdD (TMEM256/DUF423 family)